MYLRLAIHVKFENSDFETISMLNILFLKKYLLILYQLYWRLAISVIFENLDLESIAMFIL